MTDLIERMAEAIATVMEQNGSLPWSALNEKHVKSVYRDKAEAAARVMLEAMREWSDSMGPLLPRQMLDAFAKENGLE